VTTEIVRGTTETQAARLLTTVSTSTLAKHQNLASKQEEALWSSGEYSLELQEIYYPEFSKAAIRKHVGEIYSIAMHTVRDRERILASVPVGLRKALPFLKFSHWRNIVPAQKEKAEQMVWESVAMFEAEGKGPSVDQILAWRGNSRIDATPPWIYRLQKGLEKFEMLRDDPMADPEIRIICEKAITDIEERSAVIKLNRFKLEGGDK